MQEKLTRMNQMTSQLPRFERWATGRIDWLTNEAETVSNRVANQLSGFDGELENFKREGLALDA